MEMNRDIKIWFLSGLLVRATLLHFSMPAEVIVSRKGCIVFVVVWLSD